ncbi:MAG: DUF362 domain-containing protein [Clostridia bacterium]|nr:DUF362 domain-containing protein [Clostridia bacterium]
MAFSEHLVSVIQTESRYPAKEGLFRPDQAYAEYPFEEVSGEKNPVYDAVRESFHLLGMDAEHYGTKEWNPLGEVIREGQNVLIKPNMVMDYNGKPGEGVECLYTQPSVVAAVVDYVVIALHGTGKIVIGDAPMQECKFDKLMDESGYREMLDYYRGKGIDITIVDFRELTSTVEHNMHYATINPDAKGVVVDLGQESEFAGATEKEMQKARITNYDPRIMPTHHNGEKNEYLISKYILDADVIINMPKPKTHRKAGVTISLKNFVGANVRKEYLPHHTQGSIHEGGDEYEKKNAFHLLRSRLQDKKNIAEAEKRYKAASFYKWIIIGCSGYLRLTHGVKYVEGSWYGNHTISRTISDLNKIVFYADKDGKMRPEKQRQMLIVADMIISGEEEGPVCPTAKPVGIIAAGINPVAFDETITYLMGFDPEKIPTLDSAESVHEKYRLKSAEEPTVVSNMDYYDGKKPEEIAGEHLLHYIPTDGWKGHIERNTEKAGDRV